MIRLAFALSLVLLPLAARAQTEPQTLVDRATLAVQEMLTGDNGAQARSMMQRARGVLICPQVFKAGFFVGGEGGDCVLVGRSGATPQASTSPQLVVPLTGGTWSGPAFYAMAGGSFGFQIGVQDSEVIFIVLTDNGLQALLNSQFKFGADASVAFATLGGGVNGDTTAALRADIVAFAESRGLFAGVSLEGTLISARFDWNQSYYGQPLASQQIVLNQQGQNQGAEPLKEVLARFSNG